MKRPAPAEYLSPGYMPSRMTIGDLISVLSQHLIEVPSSKQNKQFYLDLFKDKLAPMGPKILYDMENTVPSSEGISLVKMKRKILEFPPTSTSSTLQLPQKRIVTVDIPSPRSVKKIKEYEENSQNKSPSRLPVPKSKRNSMSPRKPFVSLVPNDFVQQDVDCPKQERFSVVATLPGVRSKVIAPSAEFVKSVKQRALEYESERILEADMAVDSSAIKFDHSLEKVEFVEPSNPKPRMSSILKAFLALLVLSALAGILIAYNYDVFYLKHNVVTPFLSGAYDTVLDFSRVYMGNIDVLINNLIDIVGGQFMALKANLEILIAPYNEIMDSYTSIALPLISKCAEIFESTNTAIDLGFKSAVILISRLFANVNAFIDGASSWEMHYSGKVTRFVQNQATEVSRLLLDLSTGIFGRIRLAQHNLVATFQSVYASIIESNEYSLAVKSATDFMTDVKIIEFSVESLLASCLYIQNYLFGLLEVYRIEAALFSLWVFGFAVVVYHSRDANVKSLGN